MDDQPGGFVEDDDLIVAADNLEGKVLGLDPAALRVPPVDVYTLIRLQLIPGFSDRTINLDSTLLDGFSDS